MRKNYYICTAKQEMAEADGLLARCQSKCHLVEILIAINESIHI